MTIAKRRKTREITEFGDFQTPPSLAQAAITTLRRIGIRARSILEPTCGRGAFVIAAAQGFPEAERIIGIDINQHHINVAAEVGAYLPADRIQLHLGDFFEVDWEAIVSKGASPWLILGNPPWVTSSDLGSIGSENLPEKSNFQGRRGIEALTGKSNFDISEWMLLRYLDWFSKREGTIAVLCKTAVARKILLHIWRANRPLNSARIYKINAHENFGAAVDACFFVLEIQAGSNSLRCDIFDSLEAETASQSIGFTDGHISSNVEASSRLRHLLGPEERYIWRSGVKHDCSKVMEMTLTSEGCVNGLGEPVAIEDDLLYPVLKSSDIAHGRLACRGVMLVTQRVVGEDTRYISTRMALTWQYLQRHAELLSKRGSSIYKNRPQFSIFGVGPYTFAPWKVAISGFYKSLHFLKVGPIRGKPVVFDDTVYFLPCWSEQEAGFVEFLLQSELAEEFFRAMIHWDEKRPITVDILKRLSLKKLAVAMGREEDYVRVSAPKEIALPLFASHEVIITNTLTEQ